MGTLAEVIESIGDTTIAFVDTLYPVFLRMVKDEDDEVRSNAVFALGMLAANGGDKMIGWVIVQFCQKLVGLYLKLSRVILSFVKRW